jgi:RNA polymerase sigma-70 factor (ECF subfamily)
MSSVYDERSEWLRRQVLPHEQALRAWLRGRSLGGLEVDDVVQETYTRLMTAESVRHIRNARTYAFQTAASVVVDHVRKMKVISIVSVANLDLLEVISDDYSPERVAIDRDELNRLGAAIAAMPDKVRQVFTLRRVQGLSQREVAQKMGISENTVEKHMSRGFLLMLRLFPYGGKAPPTTSPSISATSRTVKVNASEKDGS